MPLSRDTIVAWTTTLAALLSVAGCGRASMAISNEQVNNHAFLQCLYGDDYFPKHLVDRGKQILVRLAERIEQEKPADVAALYVLTHAATDEFNELAAEFYESNSDIDTFAAECIAEEFVFIAEAYEIADADLEELIATRDW